MRSDRQTEPARSNTLSAARDFINCGCSPIPIPGKSKAPDMANWPTFKAELDSLEEHFSPQCNVGLLLGKRSNGLIDIDLDCSEAIALAPHWLPSTGWIHGRQSNPEFSCVAGLEGPAMLFDESLAKPVVCP